MSGDYRAFDPVIGRLAPADAEASPHYGLDEDGHRNLIQGRAGSNVEALVKRNGKLVRAGVTVPRVGGGGTPARERDPNLIAWQYSTGQTLSEADIQAGKFGGVLSNGAYIIDSPAFRSMIPGTPALIVRHDVQRPVILKRPSFFGWGTDGYMKPGMLMGENFNDVRVEDALFLSSKPPAGYPGAFPARAILFQNPKNLRLEHFEAIKTGGIGVDLWGGDGTAEQTLTLLGYLGRDIDGRRVDNSGVWIETGISKAIANAVQLNNIVGLKNARIRALDIRNDPLYGAQPEDFYSFHSVSGTVLSPITLEDFLFENGLPYVPGYDGTQTTFGILPDGSEKTWSGGLGLNADGAQPSVPAGIPKTADTMPGRVRVRRGYAFTTYNYGLGTSAGNRSAIEDVTIYSPGCIRANNPQGYSRFARGHTGLQMQDYIGAERTDAQGNPVTVYGDPEFWFDNSATNVRVGHFKVTPAGVVEPHHRVINHAATLTNVTNEPTPASPLAALARLDVLRTEAEAMLAATGIKIGVRS